MRGLIPLLALGALLAQAVPARADISYTYVTDQTTYNASAAGQSVTVTIYLNENLNKGSTSLEAANQGLVGAGFYVTQTGNVPSNPSIITAINANTNKNDPNNPGQPNDGFDGGSGVSVSKKVASDGSAARLLEGTNDIPGPVGAPTSFGRQLLLGTVVIKAGAVGTTTSYSLQTYKNAPLSLGGSGKNGNTVDYGVAVSGVSNDYDVSGTDLATGQAYTGANSLAFETFTITVAAVPEPGSLVLMTVAASTMGAAAAWRRWRNRGMAKA
jgi:hypothetical protein